MKTNPQLTKLQLTRSMLTQSKAVVADWETTVIGVPPLTVTDVSNIGDEIDEMINRLDSIITYLLYFV